jgi:HlyD family secretion protein
VHEKPKILVDPAAIVDRGNSKVVFVVQGQQVVQKQVKTASMVGSSIEVTEGVSPGDQVVLSPAPDLQNGEKIKVQS